MVSDDIWWYVVVSGGIGGICWHLVVSAIFVVSGDVWKYLVVSGGIWWYLVLSSGNWSCLVVSGGI